MKIFYIFSDLPEEEMESELEQLQFNGFSEFCSKLHLLRLDLLFFTLH